MCGRFQLELKGKEEEFIKHFDLPQQQKIDFEDNDNVSPTELVPVVVNEKFNRLVMMKWGLIPPWAKDFKGLIINSRAESIFEKPIYRRMIKETRCIIPATGFYEWKKLEKGKQKYTCGLKNNEVFGMAGIFNKDTFEFTIITCEPNKIMSEIHDRMPAILDKKSEQLWLDLNTSEEKLETILKPFESNLMVIGANN